MSKTSAQALTSVLVVEDVVIAQTTMLSLMEQMNCQVTIAGTGQEAIECTQHQFFDLIFMDIGLPDLDVLTVTEAVQQNYRDQFSSEPTIIALTAHGTEGIKTQCFRAGMQDFFVKPLTLSNAKDIFSKYLSHSEVSI